MMNTNFLAPTTCIATPGRMKEDVGIYIDVYEYFYLASEEELIRMYHLKTPWKPLQEFPNLFKVAKVQMDFFLDQGHPHAFEIEKDDHLIISNLCFLSCLKFLRYEVFSKIDAPPQYENLLQRIKPSETNRLKN